MRRDQKKRQIEKEVDAVVSVLRSKEEADDGRAWSNSGWNGPHDVYWQANRIGDEVVTSLSDTQIRDRLSRAVNSGRLHIQKNASGVREYCTPDKFKEHESKRIAREAESARNDRRIERIERTVDTVASIRWRENKWGPMVLLPLVDLEKYLGLGPIDDEEQT